MKILSLDIETAPLLAYVWQRYKQDVSQPQVIKDWYIMSWAAKWLDEEEVYYDALPLHEEAYEEDNENDVAILETLHPFMDSADVIVTQNGDQFDIPRINAGFIKADLGPVSPFKSIDTKKIAQKQFGFSSNSLDNLAEELGCNSKGSPGGFKTWIDCIAGDEDAWDRMIEYNILDVLVLEEVYLKMRPYIKNHPNFAMFNDLEEEQCPSCGSTDLAMDGYYNTQVSRFHRYYCKSCGKRNIRGRKNILSKEKKDSVLTNA